MRGLLQAGLLLVPVLASASALSDFWADGKHHDEAKDHSLDGATSRTIRLADGGSHDVPGSFLTFQIDVFPSSQICGVGNVLVNGQELTQESRGDGSSGKGDITDHKRVISASWDFDCLRGVEDEPSAQFMKFTLDAVDGAKVEDLAFSIMFRQSPVVEIVMTSPDLALDLPAPILPSYPNLSDEEDDDLSLDFENYDFEREIEDLEDMKALVQELRYRIHEKRQEIRAMAAARDIDLSIGDCDSLKCILKAGFAKARKLADKVSLAVLGEDGGHPPHHKPPHWRKPHFPGKHGNHSQGNHTCHRPHGNGSHPHPPPHWRKPHFKLPPKFCHKFCQPPPPHHKPPHGKPPHGGPPHGGPPHGGPPHGGPPHGGPPHEGPHHEPHGPPNGPPENHHDGPPHDGPSDDKPPHHGPPQDEPPHHGPPHRKGPGHQEPLDEEAPPHDSPPSFDHRRPLHALEGPPPHGAFRHWRHAPPHLLIALHALKLLFAGVLIAIFIVALRRCCCTPSRRSSKAARKEERRRRRAYRRAAQKQAWKAWIVNRFRLSSSDDEDLEYEEKYGSFAPIEGESDMEDDVASEIQQLQNATNVVSDIVAAEEGRAGRVSMESRTTSLPGYEGEELPVYEESDGTEESSFVADGFRYTPGSTEYSPGHSPSNSEAGSVRSILGDTKEERVVLGGIEEERVILGDNKEERVVVRADEERVDV